MDRGESFQASLVVTIGMLGFVGSCGYFLWLARSSPSLPDPETGQVIQMTNKRTAFFVRQHEAFLFPALMVGPAIVSMIAYFVWRYAFRGAETIAPPGRLSAIIIGGAVLFVSAYMLWG